VRRPNSGSGGASLIGQAKHCRIWVNASFLFALR
jgi:hypothetical protein